MKRTWFASGDWNAICDVCGFKFKASHLKLRWDGLMVCTKDWEPRHPQEFIRPIPDQERLPWTRPEGNDQFISVTVNTNVLTCSPTGGYCQAGYAEADCVTVGVINPGFIFP